MNGQLVRGIGHLGAGVQTQGARERYWETVFAQADYADAAKGHQFSTRVSCQVICVCAFCICLAVATLARRWAA